MEIDIILNEFSSPQEAAELGMLVEGYGLRGVWSANYGWSRDPFFTLALLAERSSNIRLGPMAVTPVELHPLKMANLLYALNDLSNGRRFIVGRDDNRYLQHFILLMIWHSMPSHNAGTQFLVCGPERSLHLL